jgi:hypothetical protein
MSFDLIVGCVVLVLALAAISYLVWWSCRTIAMIAEKKPGTVRDILRELINERKD